MKREFSFEATKLLLTALLQRRVRLVKGWGAGVERVILSHQGPGGNLYLQSLFCIDCQSTSKELKWLNQQYQKWAGALQNMA